MLRVRNLTAAPTGEVPIERLTFDVNPGEIVVVAGPNGAGKTTLCRCLALLQQRFSGTIEIDGRPLCGGPWNAVRAGLLVLTKDRRVFPELTVLQNLLVSPLAWSGNQGERLKVVFTLFPPLAKRLSQVAGTLSGGEQQMVAVGRALLANSRILVLDQPTIGLAPRAVGDLYFALARISANGNAVLIIEESVQNAAMIAKRTYEMAAGRIVREISSEELRMGDGIIPFTEGVD